MPRHRRLGRPCTFCANSGSLTAHPRYLWYFAILSSYQSVASWECWITGCKVESCKVLGIFSCFSSGFFTGHNCQPACFVNNPSNFHQHSITHRAFLSGFSCLHHTVGQESHWSDSMRKERKHHQLPWSLSLPGLEDLRVWNERSVGTIMNHETKSTIPCKLAGLLGEVASLHDHRLLWQLALTADLAKSGTAGDWIPMNSYLKSKDYCKRRKTIRKDWKDCLSTTITCCTNHNFLSTVYSESTVYTTSPPAMCSHHGYLQHPQPSCSRLSWRRSLEPCQSCPVVEKKTTLCLSAYHK